MRFSSIIPCVVHKRKAKKLFKMIILLCSFISILITWDVAIIGADFIAWIVFLIINTGLYLLFIWSLGNYASKKEFNMLLKALLFLATVASAVIDLEVSASPLAGLSVYLGLEFVDHWEYLVFALNIMLAMALFNKRLLKYAVWLWCFPILMRLEVQCFPEVVGIL